MLFCYSQGSQPFHAPSLASEQSPDSAGKGSFLHGGRKVFFLNRPLPTTQKTGEGRFPEGTVTFPEQSLAENPRAAQSRVVLEGLFRRWFFPVALTGAQRAGGSGGVRPRGLLAALFRACLVPGDTGRLSLFFLKTLCRQHVSAPNATERYTRERLERSVL